MTNYVYYVNGASTGPKNAILRETQSINGGPWSAPDAITVDGISNKNVVDPNVVVLSNGTFLLTYSYQNFGGPNPPAIPTIYAAVSSDGLNFTSAPPAFTNGAGLTLTDPTEVLLPDGTFLAAVSTLTGNPSTNSITFYKSTDGLSFTPTGVTLPLFSPDMLVLPDGSIRIFYSGIGGIASEISHDSGATWTPEAGLRLNGSYSDPSVVQVAAGQWDLVVKSLISPVPGPSGPPNHQLSLATSTDGLNFTVTQPNFAVQASVGEIVANPPFVGPLIPTVSSIAALSDTLTNYVVTITITMNEAVIVSGTPTLQLNNGEVAIYTFGSGTNALQFTYIVQPTDNIADLRVTGLSLPAGAGIVDDKGNSLTGAVAGDLALAIQGQLLPADVVTEINGLYVGLYAVAATQPGIEYWINVAHAIDASITQANAAATAVSANAAAYLGQQFVQTQSTFFNSLYATLNDTQFVTALYQNLTNSGGSSAGVDFWFKRLQAAENTNGHDVQNARAGIAAQFVHDVISIDLTPGAVAFQLTIAEYNALVAGQQAMLNKTTMSGYFASRTVAPGGDILNYTTLTHPAFAVAHDVVTNATSDPITVIGLITSISNAIAHQDLSLI